MVPALETAGRSLGTVLLRKALDRVAVLVREGKPLSSSLATTHMFPELSIDMMGVASPTGPAQMFTSVAKFYEEDVANRMTAILSLISRQS